MPPATRSPLIVAAPAAPAVAPSVPAAAQQPATRQVRDAAAGPAVQAHSEPATVPARKTGGSTSTAGSASSAAASAAALLGLLLLLTFAAQRLGAIVRLRPDWVPPPPFLALPERPG